MIDFYDVIAASEGIAVADEFAVLWGRKISGGYVITTYTGTLPATLKTVAGFLESYKIWGNTVQTGTPTPENPIMPEGVGERTENLFDGSQIQNDQSVETGVRKWLPVQLNPNTECTVSTNCPRYQSGALIFVRDSASYMASTSVNGVWEGKQRSWTTAADGILYIGYRGNMSDYDLTSFWYMLNLGSTALPYEPYGYKLPILSNDTTTDIYIGDAQLAKDEYVDSVGKIYRYVDGTLTPTDPPVLLPQIPTSAGETTISYGGEGAQPEKVELKYRR